MVRPKTLPYFYHFKLLMNYLGSKRKNAKNIHSYLKDNLNFVELFCGGLNLTTELKKNKYGKFILNDVNEYLVEYLKKTQQGWIPKEKYTEEDYLKMRDAFKNKTDKYPKHEIAYVGFTHSFMAKFFGGYARTQKENDVSRKAFNRHLKDQEFLQSNQIVLLNKSYNEVEIPKNSTVFCDPPYKNTSKYKGTNDFNHDEFWEWVRVNSKEHPIYVTEMSAPDDFVVVTEFKRKSTVLGQSKTYTEYLFAYEREY